MIKEFTPPGKHTDLTRFAGRKLQESADLDPLIDRIGNARCVMLGEASHGTHEYYVWRNRISRRLIEEKGFNCVAVEGDWPDCYKLNQFVKEYNGAGKDSVSILRNFQRWPTWMWANWEVDAFVNWLKNFNYRKGRKVGFYGLDVYSLWDSLYVLNDYFAKNDPRRHALVMKAMQCLEPFNENTSAYARSQANVDSSCREELVELLTSVRKKAGGPEEDPEAELNIEQNAQVARNAEEYYSNMLGFDNATWNIRDSHMMATVKRLMDFHGSDSKIIIWAHNTHVGDARYTDMANNGMYNLGQLGREEIGEEKVVLVGFGSHKGKVIAATEWDAQMQVMPLPEAMRSSIEAKMHAFAPRNQLFRFDKDQSEYFEEIMGHRAVGVVYHPQRESYNYVPTKLSRRYDAFLYIDVTSALHPMHIQPGGSEVPDTYPFGV